MSNNAKSGETNPIWIVFNWLIIVFSSTIGRFFNSRMNSSEFQRFFSVWQWTNKMLTMNFNRSKWVFPCNNAFVRNPNYFIYSSVESITNILIVLISLIFQCFQNYDSFLYKMTFLYSSLLWVSIDMRHSELFDS